MRFTAVLLGLILALCAAPALARDLYVSPQGTPTGDGSKEKPMDLATALSDAQRVLPGDTVWLAGGAYTGPFVQPATPAGTKDQPIIFRAAPGQRAILTAAETELQVLTISASHTWFWGLELTVGGATPKLRGSAIRMAGGDGVKLINLYIHDNPNRQGIGAWAIGNDHEIYGCLITRNGIDEGSWSHGIYTQNTKNYNTKTIADCLIYNNFGWGIHCYAQEKAQANYHYEGCVVYGNGLPEGSPGPVANFLVGGSKDANEIVVDNCYTYFPGQGSFGAGIDDAVASAIKNGGGSKGRYKRGADFGYTAKNNGTLTVRNSVFSGGLNGVEVKNWHRVTFTGNTCYTNTGFGLMLADPQGNDPFTPEAEVDADAAVLEGAPAPVSRKYDPKKSTFDNNTYIIDGSAGSHFIHRAGKAYDDGDAWRQESGWDASSQFLKTLPTQPLIVLRPNKYEPDRAHLFIYNWPATKTVRIDLAGLWKAQAGQKYRFLNVDDFVGEPVASVSFDGQPIELPMAGAYAPNFACYVVIREAAKP